MISSVPASLLCQAGPETDRKFAPGLERGRKHAATVVTAVTGDKPGSSVAIPRAELGHQVGGPQEAHFSLIQKDFLSY